MALQRKSLTLSSRYRTRMLFFGAAPCSMMPSTFLIVRFMCLLIGAAIVASQVTASQFHSRVRAGIPTLTHVLQVKFFLVVQTVRTAVQALPIALQPLMLVSVLAESSAHSDEPAFAAALALSRRSGCLAEFLKSL